MTKNWTGNLVGLLHDNKISKTQLAEEIGVTREYVSMVLNGHREPEGAEEKFTAALNRIIDRKNASETPTE